MFKDWDLQLHGLQHLHNVHEKRVQGHQIISIIFAQMHADYLQTTLVVNVKSRILKCHSENMLFLEFLLVIQLEEYFS